MVTRLKTTWAAQGFTHEVESTDETVGNHMLTIKAMRANVSTASKAPPVFEARIVDKYLICRIKDKNGDEDFKVWLYPQAGKYPFCTIYQRDFDKLWFDPRKGTLMQVNATPNSIEDADDAGIMNRCEPKRALRRETGEIGEKPEGGYYWVKVFHGWDDETEILKGSSPPKSKDAKQDGALTDVASGSIADDEQPEHDSEDHEPTTAATSDAPATERPLWQRMISKIRKAKTLVELQNDKVAIDARHKKGDISAQEYKSVLGVWDELVMAIEQATAEEDEF